MNRRGRLAQAWTATALAACGCFTKASTLADLPPLPTPAAAAGREESQEVVRSQKPDAAPSAATAVCRLLNMPVERPVEAAHANPTAAIRAVVNGELILDEELRLVCQLSHAQQLYFARTPKERQEIIKQALEVLIDREILLQDAVAKLERGGKQGEALLKKIQEMASEEFDKRMLKPLLTEKHVANQHELAELMREKGLSLDMMRRWWERNWMAQNYLYSRLEQHTNRIGHTEISEYYNSHRDEFSQPDSVDWQDIFLDATRHASREAARQFAEALLRRVRQGEDFAKLSAEFDNGESGHFRHGAGQGHKRGEIFPHEAEPVLFRLHEGDMDIVDCPRGFHLVRLVKRQYAGPIPFDVKVQKEIRDKLKMTVFLREKDSIVKELKRKAVIDRCDNAE